jgi:hypothetical protein
MLRPETVDRALQEIGKGYAQYQYFFDQLNSLAWLEPLSRHGFFQKPPEPVREGQYISFLPWPESRYLARMASLSAAQPKVLEIALRIPATENSRVHDDLADIALALTPERSAKLVPQACLWVQSGNKLLLPDKISKLIIHLAEGDQGEAALTLARAALALGPDPRAAREDDQESLLWPEPRPRFQDFYYDRIVEEAIPALVQSAGLASVRLFCDLLADFIRLSHKESETGDEDYLYLRQSEIEASKDPHDLASTLICSVRDAAERLIEVDPSQFAAVVAILRSKNWTSFRRLELHLSRVFPDEGRSVAGDFFQNPATMDRRGLRHEAVLLLKACFSDLSTETQNRILQWMDEGPPEDSLRCWLELTEQPVTDGNIRALADGVRRDYFATLEGQLPAAYQQKLADLKAAMGEGRRLEEPERITGGAISPKSPKSAEEFSQMSVEEVLSFLQSWTPGTDIFSPTAEGVGRNLTRVVTQRPDDFAAVAHRFRELDPTYVRCFLAGFTEVIKQDIAYDWRPVLELAEWVTNQPREVVGRKGSLMVTDPDWGWTRDAIIDLLTAGFEEKSGKLPYEYRELVWRILLPLTNDPSPSPADESSPHFDPVGLSINSTRGRAFYAVIRYAWWVRECTEGGRKAEGKASATLDEMPEVRDVLVAHLDIEREPTLTIRAVYGQSLPSLAAFGWDWFQENLNRILPAGEDDPVRFAAAWESFVVFDQPNTTLLAVLVPAYQRAVRQIGQPGLLRHPMSPEVRLAQHLMVYYWLGKLDFGTEDGLIEGFYAIASDGLRGHATWFVGTSVARWGDDAPPEAYERLRNLIVRRLEAAKLARSPEAFSRELSNFGYWFVSGKFEERWALDTLLSVLLLNKKTEAEIAVVKRLAEICPQYPVECVSCLRSMIEGDRERWLLVGVEDDARRLLRLALDSNRPEAALPARRLVEDLIARGHFGFRTLLT